MGFFKRFFCECGYKKNLHLGTGRQLPDAAYINTQFPAARLVDFNKALQEDRLGKIFYIENRMAYCRSCKELGEQKILHYQVNGNENTTMDWCPICEAEWNPVIGEPHCPRCGKALIEENGGFWD